MDEAVLESNHTFVSIKKTSCSTYIYAVREYVRSAKVVLWLGMTGVVGVEVVAGGGAAFGRSITAARPCAPPGGNSNRVEFPSEDINYSFTSETRWRKQKWPITTTVECNEEKFSAFFKYLQWMQLSRCHRAEFGGRATAYLLASQLWERVRIHSLLPSRSRI